MNESTKTIREWFDRGVAEKATHLLVVCDTFNYEQYPVYAHGDLDSQIAKYHHVNMQRIEETYDIALLFEPQANRHNRRVMPKPADQPAIRDNPPRDAALALDKLKHELTKIGIDPASLQFKQTREFCAFPGGGFFNYTTYATLPGGYRLPLDTCLMENNPEVGAVDIQHCMAVKA